MAKNVTTQLIEMYHGSQKTILASFIESQFRPQNNSALIYIGESIFTLTVRIISSVGKKTSGLFSYFLLLFFRSFFQSSSLGQVKSLTISYIVSMQFSISLFFHSCQFTLFDYLISNLIVLPEDCLNLVFLFVSFIVVI